MKARVGLFADGGTNTGVVLMTYELKPRLLHRQTIRLGKFRTIGLKLLELDKELQKVISRRTVHHVGFEAPFSGGHAFGSRIPICVAGKIEEVADRNKISCSEVAATTVKVIAAGRGNADKREVRRAVYELGYLVGGEHEADAVGVGLACINNWLRGL